MGTDKGVESKLSEEEEGVRMEIVEEERVCVRGRPSGLCPWQRWTHTEEAD